MTIRIDEHTRLDLTSIKHAEGLFRAADNSRAHLAAFLPWVDNIRSAKDFEEYLRHCEFLYGQHKELSFVILYQDEIIGRIGLHNIEQHHYKASVGYWLSVKFEGKGIISRSCRALIDHGFKAMGLRRIELKAAVNNTRSRAVAEKLGFTKEGIEREAEWINNEFIDLVVYSLLQHEWNLKNNGLG